MKNIKFTIISVCYNCKNDIEDTMISLSKQTFKNYEYIIIDGKSTDGTIEEIENKKKMFSNIKIISESDLGIYDAMNKGVKNATGDFIFFLNFGDSFYDNEVLEKVANNIEDNDTIYYGNYIKGKKLEISPKKINCIYILSERMICHQTIFAPLNSFKNNMFDISLKYCADRKWFYNCIKLKKIKYKKMDIVISNYDPNGLSSNLKGVTNESKIVLRNYYPEIIIKLLSVKNLIGSILRKLR